MTLKEIHQIAKNELQDLTTLPNPDFRLEQAEYNEENGIWDIVVSYLVENTNKRTSGLAMLSSDFQFHRMYKRLKINNQNEVIGFYIYNNKE